MMEKTPQAGTQGKIACFCYFDVRVEKEEMGNPINTQMGNPWAMQLPKMVQALPLGL